MSAIRGIIRKGQVVMTEPANLPDETEVEIVPVGLRAPWTTEETMSPDEIARTLAAMDEIEPFEMTDEERAAIEADRRPARSGRSLGSTSTPTGFGACGNEALPDGHRDRRRLHRSPPGCLRACPSTR